MNNEKTRSYSLMSILVTRLAFDFRPMTSFSRTYWNPWLPNYLEECSEGLHVPFRTVLIIIYVKILCNSSNLSLLWSKETNGLRTSCATASSLFSLQQDFCMRSVKFQYSSIFGMHSTLVTMIPTYISANSTLHFLEPTKNGWSTLQQSTPPRETYYSQYKS